MNEGPGSTLPLAARTLAAAGLVDAFGHLSERVEADRASITPPLPLGGLYDQEALQSLPLGELADLPVGMAKEAWIHWALYRADPRIGAVCRAQPPSTLAVAAVATELPALHGQAALLGATVPVFDDARLVRDRDRAQALVACLGDSVEADGHPPAALIMRGNGAITIGSSAGQAVARMYLLERAASTYLAAAATGARPRPLAAEEVAFWQAIEDEVLRRLWDHLSGEVRRAESGGST